MNPRLVRFNSPRRLTVPATDAQAFESDVTVLVGELQSTQRQGFRRGDRQIGELLPAGREDQQMSLGLIEECLQVKATRSRLDGLQAGEIGLAFGFALHDQLVLPDFKSEGAQCGLGVAHSQSQLKIRLAFPRQLKLESCQRGEAEVATQDRAALVGDQMPGLFAPTLGVARCLPALQAGRTEEHEFSSTVPAIHPAQDGSIDVQPPDPRHIKDSFIALQCDQRTEQHVATRQFKTVVTLGLSQLRGNGELNGVHVQHRELKRNGERRRLPCQTVAAQGINQPPGDVIAIGEMNHRAIRVISRLRRANLHRGQDNDRDPGEMRQPMTKSQRCLVHHDDTFSHGLAAWQRMGSIECEVQSAGRQTRTAHAAAGFPSFILHFALITFHFSLFCFPAHGGINVRRSAGIGSSERAPAATLRFPRSGRTGLESCRPATDSP